MAELTREYHLQQLADIYGPDQKAAYYKAFVDPTSVNLSTAENILLLDFYNEKAFANLGPVSLENIEYPLPTVQGRSNYMESLATFLNSQWSGVSVNSANIYSTSGVVAGLELLALALCKPGDEVLLPAPLWYGFHWSFSQTAALKFIPFPIDNETTLTTANVEAALKQNPNAKLLVLTNPGNPIGSNYTKELQESVCTLFLEKPDRQIICDEIYALSQVNKGQFVSALSLDVYKKYPDRIHVTWGLSKDFGLAGFRAGFIISQSPIVHTALTDKSCAASLCWFSPMVTTNYYMLQKLFLNSDQSPNPQLASDTMTLYKGLLQKQYDATATALKKGNISYLTPNDGALFFWIDLSAYLDLVPVTSSDKGTLCPEIYQYDDPREQALANYIAAPGNGLTGVLLTRGQECFNQAPGFFRVCYTAAALDQVVFGIDNMAKALNALNKPAPSKPTPGGKGY